MQEIEEDRVRTDKDQSEQGQPQMGRPEKQRFEELLNPVWTKLTRYCHAVSQDRDSACDLMSDTLLIAFQKFSGLRSEEAFIGFLFGIAFRINRRKRSRRSREVAFDSEMLSTMGHYDLTAERSMAAEELRDALRELPEKQRESVILFEISGLSLEEIRAIQGGSLSGVKSRIVRARATLAQLLSDESPTTTHISNAARRANQAIALTMKAKL